MALQVHSTTQFFLHILRTASLFTRDDVPGWHLFLTMDTARVQLMIQLPVGWSKNGHPSAYWDRWITRLHDSFIDKFHITAFDCNILLNLACIYRVFSIDGRISANSDFYDGFTHGLLDLARAASGHCVKQDLAFYVIDMCVLIPDLPPFDDALLSSRSSSPEPATPNPADDDPMPPSPSISAAADVMDISAHDSGYESFDSLPSLRTVVDSSDEDRYFSDSSEEPDSDEEEAALIREGFVVDESTDDDVSDMDL